MNPIADDVGQPSSRMRELLVRIERAAQTPLHAMTPEQARMAYAQRAQVLDFPRVDLAVADQVDIPTRDGVRLPLRRYASRVADWQNPVPALLYLHGGGFVVGSSATHDSLCRQLALRSGWMVLSLDYRLAPEHPFPTAFNDAWDALQWLHAHAAMLGVDADHLAVGGDSAGGTLAAACAIAARDASFPLRLQLLFYPGMGCAPDTASRRAFAQGPLLDAQLIDWFFGHALPDKAGCDDWRFAPILGNLADVAPAWIGLAGVDPVRDEGMDYANALRRAGVPASCRVWPGVTHDFIKMSRALPEAVEAVDTAARALRDVRDSGAP